MLLQTAVETEPTDTTYAREALRLVFDGTYERVHAPIAETLSDPIFDPVCGLSLDEAGELAYARARHVHAHVPPPSALMRDPAGLFALAEWPSLLDVSVFSLLMVHYNLCFGTVYDHGQGREDIDDLVQDLDSLRAFGPYMATELGYGNNVAALQTRARYDAEREVFVLNTPDAAAQKYMSYSGFTHLPKVAVVLARLEVGSEDCGVFPFLVRLSDADGLRPGIHAQPCPEKPVQGLDNGLTWFENFEVPRRCLLSGAMGEIDAEGNFTSRIPNPRRRFLRTMSRIYPGRLCVSSAAMGAARASVYLAVRFSTNRLTNAPGRNDLPVMAYASHAGDVCHALARAFAMTALLNHAKRAFLAADGKLAADLNVLISTTKAMTTWTAAEIIGVCRERCGAQGIFSVNRMADYVSLLQGLITAEGDNKVLLSAAAAQLAALGGRCPDSIAVGAGAGLDDPDRRSFMFARRVEALRQRVREIQSDAAHGDYFEAWNAATGDALEMARVHGVTLAHEQLVEMSRAADHPDLREGLGLLAELYALHELRAGAAGYLADDSLTLAEAGDLGACVDRVVRALVPHAPRLIEGFGLSPDLLRAPIAYDDYMDRFAQESARAGAAANLHT